MVYTCCWIVLLGDSPSTFLFGCEGCYLAGVPLLQMRDFADELITFPKPLSASFLKSVEEWEATEDPIDDNSLALAEMHANAEAEAELEVLMPFEHRLYPSKKVDLQ